MTDLFREHWSVVYGYLYRRTGDRALAEDLAQETFAKATAAFLGWRGGPPAAWLLAIARNTLTDHHRRGRPLLPLPLQDELLPGQTFPTSSWRSATCSPACPLPPAGCCSWSTWTGSPTPRWP